MASINTLLASRNNAEQMAEYIEPVDHKIDVYSIVNPEWRNLSGAYAWLYTGTYSSFEDAVRNSKCYYTFRLVRVREVEGGIYGEIL